MLCFLYLYRIQGVLGIAKINFITKAWVWFPRKHYIYLYEDILQCSWKMNCTINLELNGIISLDII